MLSQAIKKHKTITSCYITLVSYAEWHNNRLYYILSHFTRARNGDTQEITLQVISFAGIQGWHRRDCITSCYISLGHKRVTHKRLHYNLLHYTRAYKGDTQEFTLHKCLHYILSHFTGTHKGDTQIFFTNLLLGPHHVFQFLSWQALSK